MHLFVMNQNSASYKLTALSVITTRYAQLLRPFFAGLLIPFGFAPFHLPGITILGIALLYAQLRLQVGKPAFLTGFIFGLGFFGFGVTWVYVSIHVYAHLNAFLSAFITLLFVFSVSLYLGLVTAAYSKLAAKCSLLWSCFLFSALWCLGEYLRSNCFTGFPWLSLGFGQIDTPLKYLLPIIGVYGVSFLTCLAATFLVTSTQTTQMKRYVWLLAFIFILVAPSILKHQQWATISKTPLSVGVIQGNFSIRDKWDESLFWQLLQRYKEGIDQLIGRKNIIVMPESAIPIPANYVSDFLETINSQAKQAGSSVLLGIPEPVNTEETYYYNTLLALGHAEGRYIKQHIVPFGEFIPQPFEQIIRWLAIPVANLKPGKNNQPLIHVHNHPIASLICYELAYPQLLRKQLPEAEWVVSISDDGWFGHSLAMYQQLQMAQVLSLQTGRFQIVANNDGLSSIIDTQGHIIDSLPAFTSGLLEATIFPATGVSPWVYFGDTPVLLLCTLIALFAFASLLNIPIAAKHKRRYPYQPN